MNTEIFERSYDNPLKSDGTPKENKLLGEFEITEILREDAYESVMIGISDGKPYLILEREVTGYNGGSRFEVMEIKTLTA